MTLNIEQEMELLKQQPLFASLEASKLKLLAFTSEWLTYADGEILFKRGEPGDSAFLVLSGEVDIDLDGVQGDMVIATWGAGNLVGEIAALTDIPRTATARAKGELCVLKIENNVFKQLLLDAPQVALDVIRLLAKRLAITTEEIQKLRKRSSR